MGLSEEVAIENCQMLGTLQASSEYDAIDKLFETNELIANTGFTKENVVVKQLLSS
ncbi:MAG: hypothetical protein K2O43_00555 [Muribaculaceae bacterium]|nr:hypothetical protein [Muribaculaceae bacterium]